MKKLGILNLSSKFVLTSFITAALAFSVNEASAQAADSTSPGRLWGSSARVAGAIGQLVPAPVAAPAQYWSASEDLSTCTATVYGPPGASFQLIAHDASSMGANGWHQINGSGYFTWQVAQSGASVGYVDIVYNGLRVTGTFAHGNC